MLLVAGSQIEVMTAKGKHLWFWIESATAPMTLDCHVVLHDQGIGISDIYNRMFTVSVTNRLFLVNCTHEFGHCLKHLHYYYLDELFTRVA